jgi:hypothetical protein
MWRRNRKIVIATQIDCKLCGEYVNKTKGIYSDLEAVVDHKLSLKHGGHLFDLKNLQLAHRYCNGQKGERFESEISALERHQWALHIRQLTTVVQPSGIDWLNMVDTDENAWIEERENDEE